MNVTLTEMLNKVTRNRPLPSGSWVIEKDWGELSERIVISALLSKCVIHSVEYSSWVLFVVGGSCAVVGFHAQIGQGEKGGIRSSLDDRKGGSWQTGFMLRLETVWAQIPLLLRQTQARGTWFSERLLMRPFKTNDFPLWLLKLCQKLRYHEIMNVLVYFKF